MASPSTSCGPSRPISPCPVVAGYSPQQWVDKPQPSVSTSPRPAAAGYSPEQWVVVADGGQPGAEAHRYEDADDPGPPPAPGNGFDGYPPALDGPGSSDAIGHRTRSRKSIDLPSLLRRFASCPNGGTDGKKNGCDVDKAIQMTGT